MRGFLALLLGTALAVAGCQRCDLVEAELRTRERQLRETREELNRTGAYNEALQNELKDLRQSPSHKISPEQASQIYTLKEITLGRQTGGYDENGFAGDQALQVVLEPRDPDGHAIKTPGSLYVIALEIGPEGLKTPLSTWDLSSEQLRRTWRNGLLSTGYYVVLPWKKWPATNRLRVVAQFTLMDGRMFEADRDVTIRLGKGPAERSPWMLPPAVVPPADPNSDAREIELPALPPREFPESRGPLTKAKGIEPVSDWKTPPPSPTPKSIQLSRPVPNQ